MTSIVSTLLYDAETTRRLAKVLLNHTGPKDKHEALSILKSRIGVYTINNNVISREIDRYFE